MAIWYANSITGSNGNSGATEALAKATLAGAVGVASSGDEIRCTGTFVEANPNTAKIVTYRAWPHAIFDGNNSLDAFTSSTALGWKFFGITFRRYVKAAFAITGLSDSGLFKRCTFRDMPCGIGGPDVGAFQGGPLILVENLFTNLSTFGLGGIPTYNIHVPYLLGNIFKGNTASLRQTYDTTTAFVGGVFTQNVFADPIMFDMRNTASGPNFSDLNLFDFTNGKCIRSGSDITSLAAWRTSLGNGRDASSVDRVPTWADSTKGVYRWSPASVEQVNGYTVGIPEPAAVISNNVNSSLWTGGTFNNTEIDGSGNLVLSSGQTLGDWTSGELDLGAQIALRSIELRIANESTSTFVDSSIADSPGFLTVELRGSNTSPVSGSYTAVPRRAEIGAYMTSTYRYWQIKLTLRA